MSVTSTDLLAAAQRIFNAGATEADWRATCSRAYYAVYHDGKAFADSLAAAAYPGQIPAGTRPGMHHQLYTGLQNPTVPRSDARYKQSFKLGIMLENLHAARIKADYEPTKTMTVNEAQMSCVTAQNVPNLIAGQPVGTPVPKFQGAPTGTPAPTTPLAPSTAATAASIRPISGLRVIKP